MQFSWTKAVTVAAIAGAAGVAPGLFDIAHDSSAMQSLSELATSQEIALATEGRYSGDLVALMDGTYTYEIKPSAATQLSLTVDPTTNEYLIVALSASGSYFYKGSGDNSPVKGGEQFDASTASQVTSSEFLTSAVPSFIG